jgi:hypothetical protein
VPYGDGAAVIHRVERVYALALIAASAVTCFVIVSIGGTLGLLVGVAFAAVFVVPPPRLPAGQRFAAIVPRARRGRWPRIAPCRPGDRCVREPSRTVSRPS